MDAKTVDIPYKYGDQFVLWPLADVHKGNDTCDVVRLKLDVKKAADTENLLIVGVGDLLDSIIVTDKRYRKALDATPSESVVDDQIGEMCEILTPVKAKILCLGDGNHEQTIIEKAGTNPTKRLAALLGVPIYFGLSWLLKVNFREETGRGRSLTIRGHHGWGGGSRLQGADISKFSRDVLFWQADLFIYGHVHKTKADIVEEGRMVGRDSWRTFQKKMLIAGTYQRTYTTTNVSTWAESRGFPPVTIGSPIAYLKPNAEAGVDVKLLI